MEIWKACGVLVEIVDVVNMMYTNTTAQVLSPDRDTELSDILAGVLQGDTLAPYFIYYCLGLRLKTSSWEQKQPRIHS